MRDLSDSGLYFLSTQRAGLQLQGTLHAKVTEGEENSVKACIYSMENKQTNKNPSTKQFRNTLKISLWVWRLGIASRVLQIHRLWGGAPAAQHLTARAVGQDFVNLNTCSSLEKSSPTALREPVSTSCWGTWGTSLLFNFAASRHKTHGNAASTSALPTLQNWT